MKRNAIACAVASALGLIATTDVRAAAFALYEQGASGLGNAYAGAAAVAEDASTVWWNPAGMARLGPGKHFAIAGVLINPSTKFHDRGSVAPAGRPLGDEGGDAGETKLIPSAFFAMDINPRWNFGVGLNVPFGLKTEYTSTWLGRFQGISSEVKTLNVNPSVSYKLSDAMSVGFGVSYQRHRPAHCGKPGGQRNAEQDGRRRRCVGVQRWHSLQPVACHSARDSLPLFLKVQAGRNDVRYRSSCPGQ
jgi:long-chain fatty acid transport protein